MPTPDHFQLLARYNAWMNTQVYDAARRLPADALVLDRGAFFGSILGTLNHLVITDTMWFRRFSAYTPPVPPAPSMGSGLSSTLDTIAAMPVENMACTTLADLSERRHAMDAAIQAWTALLTEADLAYPLPYRNSRDVPSVRPLGALLLHVFNHQTHHRGQATTLLTQAGVNLDVTDLLVLIPDDLVRT